MIRYWKREMHSSVLSIYFLLFMSLPIDHAWAASETGPMVETRNGMVEGVHLESSNAFYGIPYAVPPVGENRWRAPIPLGSWRPDVYPADRIPPGCYQHCRLPLRVCPQTVSEDCLYLTVFSPKSATNSSNFPVMLFIHGGRFTQGAGYSFMTDGRYYANHTETVMVFINYRLGTFGFLVTEDGEGETRGNYGILDQRLALEWVQSNIASFGGNPNMVTLLGQSAGAQSVAIHLTSSHGRSMFQRTIMESFPFSLTFRTPVEAVTQGNYVARALACPQSNLQCMRSRSAEDVLEAEIISSEIIINPHNLFEIFEPWGPYVDGDDVTQQSLDAFKNGEFREMPIIIGTNTDEARIVVFGEYQTAMTIVDYYAFMAAFFPNDFLKIIAQYPPYPPGSDQREQLSIALDHFLFECPKRVALRGIVEYGNGDVWTYLFDHKLSFDAWGPSFEYCVDYSCHGAELAFDFHTAPLAGFSYTPPEEVLSRSMVYYWSNLAHAGNPNGGTDQESAESNTLNDRREFAYWPVYSNLTDLSYMHFMTPRNRVDTDYLKEKCDFWDSLDLYT